MFLSVSFGRYNVRTSDTGSIKDSTDCAQFNLRDGEEAIVGCNSKIRTLFIQRTDHGMLSLCRVLVYGKY